eukprot:UN08887
MSLDVNLIIHSSSGFVLWVMDSQAVLLLGEETRLFVKAGPFFNRNKIVVMHEVGHCLGCGDKAGYCQSDFEQFAQVTGKRYLTAMGGGATCDDTLYGGLEKLKLPLYEDATKQYCESGVCLTLAPPEKECTTTIKNKFEEQVGKLKHD